MTELEKIVQKANEFGVSVEWARRAKMSYLKACDKWIAEKLADLDKNKPPWLSGANFKLYNHIFESWKKRRIGFQIRVKNLRKGKMSEEKKPLGNYSVDRAREFPIEQLLDEEVRRGRLHCPFHEDKHPSAGVKNNKLHCFVCNKTWNPIDYLIEKEGISFSDAVRRLS